MECQVRLRHLQFQSRDTTVLAHYRLAGTCGVGMKPPDLLGAWACSKCHDYIDGRFGETGDSYDYRRLMHAEGCLRTINELLRRGKIEGLERKKKKAIS